MTRFAFLRAAVLSAALVMLAGCGTLTKTIDNPVGPVDIYRVKNTYAVTLELVVAWRQYCWARPYAVLMADAIAKPVCQNRRSTLRTIQATRPKVAASIKVADNFVKNNPTLSAATVIGAAWTAVTDFRALVPTTP